MSRIFDKLAAKLAVQKNMSPRIGAMINVYQTTALIYAPLTLMGVATTVYGLWGSKLIVSYLPWFTIYHLLGMMIGFILLMMIFFYKIIIPSIVAFSVQQTYKHRNPLVADVQEVLRVLRKMENRLDALEKAVKKEDDNIEGTVLD